jgi:hypothetical protein
VYRALSEAGVYKWKVKGMTKALLWLLGLVLSLGETSVLVPALFWIPSKAKAKTELMMLVLGTQVVNVVEHVGECPSNHGKTFMCPNKASDCRTITYEFGVGQQCLGSVL